MNNIQKLVQISSIDVEDKAERLIIELAILENISYKEIKGYSYEKIDRLIKKYDYLYITTPEANESFTIEGVEYKLPITLYNTPYAVWEDMEVINKTNQLYDPITKTNISIETFWEKFPYLLYILTHKNYADNGADNLIEGSKVFYNISIKDALAVKDFFLLLKMPLHLNIAAYIKLKKRKLMKDIKTNLQEMSILKDIIKLGVRTQ
jgi:hypothetical protein